MDPREFIIGNGPGRGGARYYEDEQGNFWGHPLDEGDMGEYLWDDRREYLGAGTWAAAQRGGAVDRDNRRARDRGNRARFEDEYGRREPGGRDISLLDRLGGRDEEDFEDVGRRSRCGREALAPPRRTDRIYEMGRRARSEIEDFSDRFEQRHQRFRDSIHAGVNRGLDRTVYRAADGLEQGFRNLAIGRDRHRREPSPYAPYAGGRDQYDLSTDVEHVRYRNLQPPMRYEGGVIYPRGYRSPSRDRRSRSRSRSQGRGAFNRLFGL